MVYLTFFWIVRGYAQSGSFGNTFIATSGEMGIIGVQHNFQQGSGGELPGIVKTERTAPQGYLSFSDGATYQSATDNAHVDGYVRTYNTSAFTFPIGNGTVYRPLSIPAPGSPTSYEAAYFSVNPSMATLPAGAPFSSTSLGTGVVGVSPVEYWDLDGTVATTVTLTWNAASNLNTLAGGVLANLRVVGYNSSTTTWENLGQAAITGMLSGTGTLTSALSFVPNTYSALTFGVMASPDLSISLGQPSPVLVAGVTSSLPISVSNIGSEATTNPITVTLTFPADLTVPTTFTTGNFGCEVASGVVSCTSTTPIAAGASTTLAVPVTPTPAAIGSFPTFTGGTNTPTDSNPANNTATVTSVSAVQPATLVVSVKAWLQGAGAQTNSPTLANADGLMRDDLRVAGLLPTTEPYTALGYSAVVATSIAPSVTATTGADAIVDWILLELRDANQPTTVVRRQAALLQRDGDIVATDGVSPVSILAPTGSYYVAVRHRNHLGAMLETSVGLSGTVTSVNFTNTTATYGANAQTSVGGKYSLWAGNANGGPGTTSGQNTLIAQGLGSDRSTVTNQVTGASGNSTGVNTFISAGYQQTDVNMDGKAIASGQRADNSFILNVVLSSSLNSAAVNSFIITQQLP
ncbi:hypothetical protein [Spirosoma linguale]|uniref:hypothetical protein n=1 Tax=Spirosoma linguale TaxID=108 RepID=UPI003CC7C44C